MQHPSPNHDNRTTDLRQRAQVILAVTAAAYELDGKRAPARRNAPADIRPAQPAPASAHAREPDLAESN